MGHITDKKNFPSTFTETDLTELGGGRQIIFLNC